MSASGPVQTSGRAHVPLAARNAHSRTLFTSCLLVTAAPAAPRGTSGSEAAPATGSGLSRRVSVEGGIGSRGRMTGTAAPSSRNVATAWRPVAVSGRCRVRKGGTHQRLEGYSRAVAAQQGIQNERKDQTSGRGAYGIPCRSERGQTATATSRHVPAKQTPLAKPRRS